MAAKSVKVTTIMMVVRGGEAPNPAVLAPKCGPLGLSPKKIGKDIEDLTKDEWDGLRVKIKMDVQNRQATYNIIPTASAVIIRALNEPKRDRKKEKEILHNGDLSLVDIVECAKIMRANSNARFFVGTVMELLGTCVSIGCTVEGSDPREIQKKIKSGEITINEPETE